ncbi:MAG: glutamate 5-kinase [Staphylococcus sp.]|nr:glutamate 5-kinase [Staphylococcus sp.]
MNSKSDKKLRIVVKVGSNVLTRQDGKPNVTNMSALVDQIAALRSSGHEVILVSSGAVACGRGAVKPARQLDAVAQRQLYSSVGQIRLINIYNSLFGEYGLVVGQVLTQKENFSSRTAYLNQRACMQTMLENGVVPIVNENDTASLTELMFTDNDELSGLIASMMDADMLVILSNVDGIYDGDPADQASVLIKEVGAGEDVSSKVVAVKSGFGRGGMGTKCGVAMKLADEGISVVIARGDRKNVLVDLVERSESTPHTRFAPRPETISNIKRWIAHSGSFAKGVIRVDANAAAALCSDRAVSLLPIGVTSVEGEWEEGDIVTLLSPDDDVIGVGRAAVGSEDVGQLMGKRGEKPIVYYDYLFIEN